MTDTPEKLSSVLVSFVDLTSAEVFRLLNSIQSQLIRSDFMMLTINKLFGFALILFACFAYLTAGQSCPSSTKVTNCTPKCLQDSECSAIGGKCCPNLCNQRSCIQPNQLGNADSKSPFDKNSGGSGAYCGNVKCGSFEKCESDRSTKRPKCVRA